MEALSIGHLSGRYSPCSPMNRELARTCTLTKLIWWLTKVQILQLMLAGHWYMLPKDQGKANRPSFPMSILIVIRITRSFYHKVTKILFLLDFTCMSCEFLKCYIVAIQKLSLDPHKKQHIWTGFLGLTHLLKKHSLEWFLNLLIGWCDKYREWLLYPSQFLRWCAKYREWLLYPSHFPNHISYI